MILPKTTYQTNQAIPISGIAYVSNLNCHEGRLPANTEFEISIWTNPYDECIQVKLLHATESNLPTDLLLERSIIEANCTLTTDFGQAIYFYASTDAYGDFSNFSNHGIEQEGLFYPTVEHFYQAQKFENKVFAERIRKAQTAKEASILGKSRDETLKGDWDKIKNGVMAVAVRTKFETHQELKKQLLETGDALLIESSPYDYYWGIGTNGNGLNHLGTILMRTRAALRI